MLRSLPLNLLPCSQGSSPSPGSHPSMRKPGSHRVSSQANSLMPFAPVKLVGSSRSWYRAPGWAPAPQIEGLPLRYRLSPHTRPSPRTVPHPVLPPNVLTGTITPTGPPDPPKHIEVRAAEAEFNPVPQTMASRPLPTPCTEVRIMHKILVGRNGSNSKRHSSTQPPWPGSTVGTAG